MDTQSSSDIGSAPDSPLGQKTRQPENGPPPKQEIKPVMHPGPGLQHPHKPPKR